MNQKQEEKRSRIKAYVFFKAVKKKCMYERPSIHWKLCLSLKHTERIQWNKTSWHITVTREELQREYTACFHFKTKYSPLSRSAFESCVWVKWNQTFYFPHSSTHRKIECWNKNSKLKIHWEFKTTLWTWLMHKVSTYLLCSRVGNFLVLFKISIQKIHW